MNPPDRRHEHHRDDESYEREHHREGDTAGDASRWRILLTIASIVAMCSVVFAAGFSWASVAANAKDVAELKQNAVMKDGREMEALRGQLLLIDQKLSVLVNQGRTRQ